VLIQ
jgi:hypothetical protein